MKMIIEEIEGKNIRLIGDEISRVLLLPISIFPENYELNDIVEVSLNENEIEKSSVLLLKEETEKRKNRYQEKRKKLLNRKKD